VYCAVRSDRPPALPRAAAGLPGLGRPRLVDAGRGRWLVVADAPRARYGEAAIARGLRDLDWVARCAVAHAAVVESCMPARAVVPMKLFTIFDSDERAVADIAHGGGRLDAALRRVAGRAEYGVRIRRSRQPATRAPVIARTGAQYLAAKRRALESARTETARGSAQAERAFRRLAARAVDAVRQSPPAAADRAASALVLDAAFLVSARQQSRFRTAARQLAKDLDGRGYLVELTGPWPAYNFIEG
jgi:hypothetical protein